MADLERRRVYPLWSNNRGELFYETEDNRIMVLEYTVDGDAFVRGKRRGWSEKQIAYMGAQNLDLAPDRKRFVVDYADTVANEKGPSVHFTMFENFFDALRQIPAGGMSLRYHRSNLRQAIALSENYRPDGSNRHAGRLFGHWLSTWLRSRRQIAEVGPPWLAQLRSGTFRHQY